MSDYQTLEIRKDFKVELAGKPRKPRLSDDKASLIERIWQSELKANPFLFNGQLFSAQAYDKNKLTGAFVPFKYFIAQVRKSTLKSALKIRPVGISGLTLLGDNVMIGKRAPFVTQYPNCYELAPSGSVDDECVVDHEIDLQALVKKELLEEVGIEAKRVKSIRFFILAHDKKTDLIDLCALIKVQSFVLQSRSGEYSQLMTIPKSELSYFVAQNKMHFVPLSLLLLQIKKLI